MKLKEAAPQPIRSSSADFDADFNNMADFEADAKPDVAAAPAPDIQREVDAGQDVGGDMVEEFDTPTVTADTSPVGAAAPLPKPIPDPETEFVLIDNNSPAAKIFANVYVSAGAKISLIHPAKAINEIPGVDLEKGDYKLQYNVLKKKLALKVQQSSVHEPIPIGGGFELKTTWTGASFKEDGLELSAIESGVQGEINKETAEGSDDLIKWIYTSLVAAHPFVATAIDAGFKIKFKISAKVFIDALDFQTLKKMGDYEQDLKTQYDELDELEKQKRAERVEYDKKKKEYLDKREQDWRDNPDNRGKTRPSNEQRGKWKRDWKKTDPHKSHRRSVARVMEKWKSVNGKIDDIIRKQKKLTGKLVTKFGQKLGFKTLQTSLKWAMKALGKLFIILEIVEVIIGIAKVIKYWDYLDWPWAEGGESLGDAGLFDDVPEKVENPKELDEVEQQLLEEQEGLGGGIPEGAEIDPETYDPNAGGDGGNTDAGANAGENSTSDIGGNADEGNGNSGGAGTDNTKDEEEEEKTDYPDVNKDVYGEEEEKEEDPVEFEDETMLKEYDNLTEGEQLLFDELHKAFIEKEGRQFTEEELKQYMEMLDKYYREKGKNVDPEKARYIKNRLQSTDKEMSGEEYLKTVENVMFEDEKVIPLYDYIDSDAGDNAREPENTEEGQHSEGDVDKTDGPGGEGELGGTEEEGEVGGDEKDEDTPVEQPLIPAYVATTEAAEERGKDNKSFEVVSQVIKAGDQDKPANTITVHDLTDRQYLIQGKPTVSKLKSRNGVPVTMNATHSPSGSRIYVYGDNIRCRWTGKKYPSGNLKFVFVNTFNIRVKTKDGGTQDYWQNAGDVFTITLDEFKHQVNTQGVNYE